jgi:hypothetical protein
LIVGSFEPYARSNAPAFTAEHQGISSRNLERLAGIDDSRSVCRGVNDRDSSVLWIGRDILGATAILAFFVTAYRVWADERWRVIDLEGRLLARIKIEFDPTAARFVSPTRTSGGINMRYIRVIVRALSPVVRDCRAYLERISYWDGQQYVSLFDEQLPMPWSYENPNAIAPRVLNHDVDAMLDVAWLAEPTTEMVPFGILNAQSILPNSFQSVLHWTLQHPTNNLKLDILVTAAESETARLSLNIHRGAPRWDEAQIGWMEGNFIRHREANF